MSGMLCLFICRNFVAEAEAVIAVEAWKDVVCKPFPCRCGRPPLAWDEMTSLLPEDCSEVVMFGRSCLKDLKHPPDFWPAVVQIQLEACFDLLAGTAIVAEAIERGAYLVTPAWLDHWRENLDAMQFDDEQAAEFFHESVRELLLLDTGLIADAAVKLDELAALLRLPATRLVIGLDYLRQFLGRVRAEWEGRTLRRYALKREKDFACELADHQSAMDFLGRLPLMKDERETVVAIEELFHMLFAPQVFFYAACEQGCFTNIDGLPGDYVRQINALKNSWAWLESKAGFLLRIARASETLGVVVVDRFVFPEYRYRYLNLAIAIAGVAGLAIDNARTYRRIRQTEVALRSREQSLIMAQTLARIGDWEMNFSTGESRWSDEVFRMLGYRPGTLKPGYEAFLQAVHVDDRESLIGHIQAARGGKGFDMEFRVVLADGRIRVLHGIVEAVSPGAEAKPLISTALMDEENEHFRLLGVIQDITERKELELRLEHEAHTDPLTGCANRRYFLQSSEMELARALRYGLQVSFMMLDLDHFKAVNDEYGHQVGDSVLCKLAHVCKAVLRAQDLIGRLGGEEFAVLLPETGGDEAREVAERLCIALAAARISLGGAKSLGFTASIGVASLEKQDTVVASILGRADEALYAAKAAGRNRVVASV